MFSDYTIKIELVIDGSIKDILLKERDVKSQEASKKYNGRNQERKKKTQKTMLFYFSNFIYILYLILELSSVSFLHDPSSSLN